MSSTLNIAASEHPIKSVTVFKSSKAEVVRTFILDLKKGQNKVEIRGLPSSIDTQAVRVSGLGTARLFDVVCTVGTNNAASYAVESSFEVIRTLKVKKASLESEKSVRDHEAELLVSYGKTLTGEFVNPNQMSQFLETFVTQGQKNLEAITALTEAIIQVDRQIEAEEHKTTSKKGQTQGEVTIVIGADESEKVELKLTYIVGGTNWVPTYELHATNKDGKPLPSVTLHYRARVCQSTGEDWTNTALTLSTVSSDTVAKQIPRLTPLKIKHQATTSGLFRSSNFQNKGFQFNNNIPHPPTSLFGAQAQQPTGFGAAFGQSAQLFQQAAQTGVFPGGLFGAAGHAPTVPQAPPPPEPVSSEEADHEQFEEIELPKTISEPTTVVTETPMAISFAVHGQSTIPSDGVYHRVSVAVLPFEADISYVSIPRIEPQVYLQCQVKNTSDYRLLPGPVSIILDDSYVSKTEINEVNTGDNFICTLGNDASIKVTYSRKSKTVKEDGGSFSEAKNVTTYTTHISIHNKHQFALPQLIIRDIIPTCDDKRAKIILRKPAALADAKDGESVTVKDDEDEDEKYTGLKVGWEKVVDGKGGEKEGRFEWKWKVDAGKKVSLEAQWEVKAPADVNWVETPFFS